MKKSFQALLIGLSIAIAHLHAQVATEDIGSQNITPPAEEDSLGAFFFKANIDVIGRAKVEKCHDLRHLKFGTGLAQLSMIVYYNQCYREGVNIAVAYQKTHLDWRLNPFFNEKNFNTVSVLLGAFTERFDCWLWRAQVTANFDNTPHWNVEDYMNYDLLLWGRYEYCKDFGVNIGFLAQTGMKIDRVYPIVGFDWKYKDWKINVIYPVNISVIYDINCAWSVAVASRFFDQRHRVKKNEYLSKGLWHYTSSGAEFAVNYNPGKWLTANIHAGYSFGGHITIADRHYRQHHRLRLDSAPYAGAEITINF